MICSARLLHFSFFHTFLQMKVCSIDSALNNVREILTFLYKSLFEKETGFENVE